MDFLKDAFAKFRALPLWAQIGIALFVIFVISRLTGGNFVPQPIDLPGAN